MQESKALLDDMKSDGAWYQTGIVTAAIDVISKTTLLTQKIATAASSTTTYGFDAGIQLDIHADKTKSDTHSTTSRGSTLTAQNISIDTGTEHTKADTSTTLQGSKLQANQNIDINTGELNVLASKDTHTNRTKTKAIDASINQTFYGSSTGLHVNVSASESESKSRSTTYTNSQLLAGDTLAINTTGDTIINGGNLDAKVIKADIGGNLTIESKQNRNSSSNKSRGISAGFGTDNNSALSSVNGGINFGNGRSNEKQTVRSSVTANHVDITVAEHTQLTGSTLAATDAQRNDTGKLTLATNTFGYQNLADTRYNKQINGGVSINVGVGKKEKSIADNQAKDAKGDKTLNVNSSNIQYKNESEQSRTTALATLGQGELIITSNQDAEESTLGLNRDVNTTEKDIFDVTRTQGNIDVTVDHRLFNEKGREEIAEDAKKTGENTQKLGNNIVDITHIESAKDNNSTSGTVYGVLNAITGNIGGLIANVAVLVGQGDIQHKHIQMFTEGSHYLEGREDEFEPIEQSEIYNKLSTKKQQELQGRNLLVSIADVKIIAETATYQNPTNGMLNDEGLALINGMQQSFKEGQEVALTQNYNPTHGVIADLLESAIDKVGLWKTGIAKQTGEFVREVTTARGPDGANFNNHSQGNILVQAGLDYIRALGAYENGGFMPGEYFIILNDKNKVKKDGTPSFGGYGSPVNTEDMKKTVKKNKFNWQGAVTHEGDFVGEGLGGNAGVDGQSNGLLPSLPDAPKLFTETSPHSTYHCGEGVDSKIICGDR